MTYNVFGGTLSLTQSINHFDTQTLISQTADRREKYIKGLDLRRTRKILSDNSPIHALKVKANKVLAHLRAGID